MTQLAGSRNPGVMRASPVRAAAGAAGGQQLRTGGAVNGAVHHRPPNKLSLAALTMASTASVVMSARRTLIMASLALKKRSHGKIKCLGAKGTTVSTVTQAVENSFFNSLRTSKEVPPFFKQACLKNEKQKSHFLLFGLKKARNSPFLNFGKIVFCLIPPPEPRVSIFAGILLRPLRQKFAKTYT